MELPELLQRIVIDTSGLQQGSAGFDSFVGNAARSLGRMPGVIGASIAAPLLAIEGIAVKAGFAVDDANRQIQRTSGETGHTLAGLEDSFKAVASSGPESFSQVSTALVEVHQRTGLVGNALEHVTTSFLDLERISGQTFDFSKLQGLAQAFNVEAAKIPGVLDDIYAASTKSGVPISTLLSLLQTGGPTFRAFGLDIGQSATLIGNLDKAGIPASQAVRALTFEMRNAAKEGKEPRQALEEFVNSVHRLIEAGDIAGATDLGRKLFGRPGQSLVEAIAAGRISLETFNDVIKATGPGVEETAKKTQSLAEQMEKFKNQATIGLAPLGQSIIPQLRGALDLVLPPLIDAVTWFGKLPAPIVDAGIALGGIVYIAGRWGQNIESMVNLGGRLIDRLQGIRAAHVAAAEAADAQGAAEIRAGTGGAAGAAGGGALATAGEAGSAVGGLNAATPGANLFGGGAATAAAHELAAAETEVAGAATLDAAAEARLATVREALGVTTTTLTAEEEAQVAVQTQLVGVQNALGVSTARSATTAVQTETATVGLASTIAGFVVVAGLAVGAGFGIRDALNSASDATKQYDEAMKKVEAAQTAVAHVQGDKLVPAFNQSVQASIHVKERLREIADEFGGDAPRRISTYAETLHAFNRVAREDPSAGAGILASLRDRPRLYAAAAGALYPLIAAQERHKQATAEEQQKEADTAAIQTYIKSLQRGKATLDEFAQAQEAALTAGERGLSAELDVATSRNRATDALAEENRLLQLNYITGGLDADGQRQLRDATISSQQAAIAYADSVDKQVTSVYGAAAGAAAHKLALQELADQAQGPTRDAILALIDTVAKIPPTKEINIFVTGTAAEQVAEIQRALNELHMPDIAGLAGSVVTGAGQSGKAASGMVIQATSGGRHIIAGEAGADEILVPTNDPQRALSLLQYKGFWSTLMSQTRVPSFDTSALDAGTAALGDNVRALAGAGVGGGGGRAGGGGGPTVLESHYHQHAPVYGVNDLERRVTAMMDKRDREVEIEMRRAKE